MLKLHHFKERLKAAAREIKPCSCLVALAGSAILAFGLYHVHSHSGVTEGGTLGLTLLLHHHFSLSPAITGAILNLLCYLLGWRLLGATFLFYSAVAGGGFSLFYALFEQSPTVFPALAEHPLWAAVVGAVFVGVGVGLCVWAGGAPSGDDALAMSLSRITHLSLRWIYLFTDLTVLGLSATYLPPARIACSLLSAILSGQIIQAMQILPISVKRIILHIKRRRKS